MSEQTAEQQSKCPKCGAARAGFSPEFLLLSGLTADPFLCAVSQDCRQQELEVLCVTQAARIAELEAENAKLKAHIESVDGEPNRCPVMLPNTYGKERCGRRKGHEGNCCYARGD